MRNKTTIQDIADSLSLSRATVSKVLNHAPGVAESTRQTVLAKIQELQYQNTDSLLTSLSRSVKSRPRSFAFLMHSRPDDLHVGSSIMTRLEQEIRKEGYSLTIHTITEEDYQLLELPPNLYIDQTEAIVCLELFHDKYSQLLCSLNRPVLFVDACANFHDLGLQCDLLMMENRSSAYRMLSALCRKHHLRTMGFYGDIHHCLSFRERYEGMQMAALDCRIETKDFHVIDGDYLYSSPEWIESRLREMRELPQLFFCANDVLAQGLILQLEKMGLRVPEDILVCGFDGIPTQNPIISSLTTVRTPGPELGTAAAQLLMNRIQSPHSITTSTYLHTEVLFRSTAP